MFVLGHGAAQERGSCNESRFDLCFARTEYSTKVRSTFYKVNNARSIPMSLPGLQNLLKLSRKPVVSDGDGQGR